MRFRLASATELLLVAFSVFAYPSAAAAPPQRVHVADRALVLGRKRFLVRGVAYANIQAGPAPCLFARDLPLMAAMGANTVRTYALLPEGDKTFVELLESTGLHWLAGFPLDPFYDPSLSLAEQRDRILQAFRKYAFRFRGQRRLIGYVFGHDVASDYSRKFRGDPAEFYALLGEAAALLKEIEPADPPLLTTSVRTPEETVRSVPGLSFWSLEAFPGIGPLEKASAPILISEFAVESETDAGRRAAEIESSGRVLGAAYPWRGIFEPTPAGVPGLDSLRPRPAFFSLAGYWRGSFPAAWTAPRSPRLEALEDGRPGSWDTSPGALVRLGGAALLQDTPPYTNDAWPLTLGTSCLCVGAAPARLRYLSPSEISAQIPWGLEPGESQVVFFRAGVASNLMPITIRQFSAEVSGGTVLDARIRRR